MKKDKGLSDRQRRAILALCETATKERAARAVGISKTTLFEWIKQGPFKAELERVRAELYAEGLAVLKASTSRAAGVLLALLTARDKNIRRLAAGQILQLGLKAAELETMEGRLAKLEGILAAGSLFGGLKPDPRRPKPSSGCGGTCKPRPPAAPATPAALPEKTKPTSPAAKAEPSDPKNDEEDFDD